MDCDNVATSFLFQAKAAQWLGLLAEVNCTRDLGFGEVTFGQAHLSLVDPFSLPPVCLLWHSLLFASPYFLIIFLSFKAECLLLPWHTLPLLPHWPGSKEGTVQHSRNIMIGSCCVGKEENLRPLACPLAHPLGS